MGITVSRPDTLHHLFRKKKEIIISIIIFFFLAGGGERWVGWRYELREVRGGDRIR